MYVDESGINTCLVREYGRAPCGEIVEGAVSGRKFQRLNVIGGYCSKERLSIECYKTATNAAFFETWFSGRLLKEVPRGCTIVIDRAGFHRKTALLGLIKKARRKITLLFLPAYSPDFNPIEKSWANMKRSLRDILKNFASVDAAVYNHFGCSVV